MVIHISSYSIIKIIEFDLGEGSQRDIIIGGLRFFIQVAIWLQISHMMIKVGSSSTQVIPSFSTSLDGLINQSEKLWKLHKNLNNIPRLKDIWIPKDPLPLESSNKFFNFECNSELKEGDIIVTIELSRFVICTLS